jgi:hypothetical protein
MFYVSFNSRPPSLAHCAERCAGERAGDNDGGDAARAADIDPSDARFSLTPIDRASERALTIGAADDVGLHMLAHLARHLVEGARGVDAMMLGRNLLELTVEPGERETLASFGERVARLDSECDAAPRRRPCRAWRAPRGRARHRRSATSDRIGRQSLAQQPHRRPRTIASPLRWRQR